MISKITNTLAFREVLQTPGSGGSSVVPGCEDCRLVGRCFSRFLLQKRQKREPTSGLEPLTCSLRVIRRAFLDVAGGCETRIPKPFSLLRLAHPCRVLRPRCCQSGVSSPWIRRRQFLCNTHAQLGYSQERALVFIPCWIPYSLPVRSGLGSHQYSPAEPLHIARLRRLRMRGMNPSRTR